MLTMIESSFLNYKELEETHYNVAVWFFKYFIRTCIPFFKPIPQINPFISLCMFIVPHFLSFQIHVPPLKE